MLIAVYQYRVLSTVHFDRLFFPATTETRTSVSTRCHHRLKGLTQHGLLCRIEQPILRSEGTKPYLYTLDNQGAQFVCELLELAPEDMDWRPKDKHIRDLFLDHLLATNDVRVAVALAARQQEFNLETWTDERTLHRLHANDAITVTRPQGGKERIVVVPDGYFRLNTGEYVYHNFLEIDRRTVTVQATLTARRSWERKIHAYLEYYRSGKYQERYRAQGLRVLTVTTGERRLANLKVATENAGGKSRFWFTTFERVASANVLTEPIWEVAGREGKHSWLW